MKSWFLRAAVVFMLTTGLTDYAASQDMYPEVPYVPTTENVVDKMLELAKITGSDVVYDLGCGDGRIVITAAKRYGARGIGIDIDPQRIRESRENAVKAGVTDRVTFHETDLFEADISPASVVTLYLLTFVNLKLRPKLFEEIRPGTRIVSHNYGMDEWKPDYYTEVPGRWDSHKVYYWVMPANVSGTWTWIENTVNGDKPVTMRIDQYFQEVNGKIVSGEAVVNPSCMTLHGEALSFVIEDERGVITYEGHAAGDVIEGMMKSDKGSGGITVWRAARDPKTVNDIDIREKK